MAAPSRLSYADLAKKNITARAPNDVQRTSTSTATTTTATASTVLPPLTKVSSTVTAPSACTNLAPRPPSPPVDATSNDAKTIWDIRKDQLNGRQTTAARSSIPSTSQNSLNGSITDDDDPFVVRMPHRPAVSLNDTESWPAVGKTISTPSVATTPAPASQTGTPPRKNEKKWVPIPPEEMQAALDAQHRPQTNSHSRNPSNSHSLSRQPRNTPGGSASGSQRQSRANSRVQSRTSSPRVPRGRRLPDENEAVYNTGRTSQINSPHTHSQPLPAQQYDSSFSFPPRSVHSSPYYAAPLAPMYLHNHHPSQTPPQHQHMPLPSPYPMYPQPHPHQFDYNQPSQPYMYWNGYGPSGSGSHTPEYVGYPYAQPLPFHPHSRAEFIPASQHLEQPTTNGNSSTHLPISSTSTSAVKPPRPEDSDAVAGPALERGRDTEGDIRRKVIFGSIGLPGSSKAPSPAPPSTTAVSDVEKTFSGFSIGISDPKGKEPVIIDLTESTPKWEFGTTTTADDREMGDTQEKEAPQLYASAASNGVPHSPAPQHPPLAPLHIPQYFSAPPPFSNYIPNGREETENHAAVYQPLMHPAHYAQHQPTLSMSSSRNEIPPYDPNAEEDAELKVRDFGFGFGAVSGSGYAVSLAREEQGRRQRERERERDHETQDIVNGGPEMWGHDDKREEPLSSVSMHSGSPQERSFFPIRGKRGHYGGYSDRGGYERRGGRGRGFGRGRAVRGGGYHHASGAYSPQQHHYAPQFAGGEGMRYGEAYYGGHVYAPPQFPTGYYDYDVGGYRAPPPQEESPVAMPAIHHSNGASPQNPNMPPLPTPITQLSFPLDATRYYVLGQVEYYLSMQNMAQDLFLRKRMDSQGWISISLLATFNRVKQLTNGENVDLVREVLELSSVVEMHPSRESVRMYDWERYVLPPEVKDNGSLSTKTSSSEMAASPVTPDDTSLEHEHEEGKEEDEEEDDVVFVLGGEAGYVDVRS